MFLPFTFIVFQLLLFVLKVCIFSSGYKIVPGVSFDTWNSPSVAFFANTHVNTLNKEWRQEGT